MKILFVLFATIFYSKIAICAPPTNGQWWNSMSSEMQLAYVIGWQDGILHATFELAAYYRGSYKDGVESLTDSGKTPARDSTFFKKMSQGVDIDNEVIREQIAKLYNDPANSYIDFDAIRTLAILKIKGGSIDKQLIQLRGPMLKVYNMMNNPLH